MADGGITSTRPGRRAAKGASRRWLPWTKAELAALRRLWPSTVRARVEKALPGRAWTSIAKQASVLRLRRQTRPRWTEAQNKLLRRLWPDCTRRTICRAVGKRWEAVRLHARKLGIAQEKSRWAGYVSMQRAAEIAGVSPTLWGRIQQAYHRHYKAMPKADRADLPSPVVVVSGRPSGERKARANRSPRSRSGQVFRVIESQAVLDAMAWWDSLESRRHASERTGFHVTTLGAFLRRGGHRFRKQERRPAAWWDALIKKHWSGVRIDRRRAA